LTKRKLSSVGERDHPARNCDRLAERLHIRIRFRRSSATSQQPDQSGVSYRASYDSNDNQRAAYWSKCVNFPAAILLIK